jgi:predicted GH43/DUF377 family glycosyl hydrolase
MRDLTGAVARGVALREYHGRMSERWGLPGLFCINLASSRERRRRMERRLAHHGLLEHTTFVTALPASVPPSATAEQRTQAAGRACSASHLRALRRALEHPDCERLGAIVCEDDVLLHDEFVPRLRALLEDMPAGIDVCLLGYVGFESHPPFAWGGRRPDRRTLFAVPPLGLWGLFMYWVTADRIREVLAAHDDVAPEALSDVSEPLLLGRPFLAAHPPLVLEDVVGSTIRSLDDLGKHVIGQSAWSYRDYAACEQGHDVSPLARLERRRIGLAMIVRDEAAVIERCLRSVRPLIDTWTICDTGSRDGTPEIIERVMADLPGELHHRPWQDFGHNRSELLELAAHSADYLLLVDADMTLEWIGPLICLTADAYLLRHRGDPEYAVPRLVRTGRSWRYEGSTHEYLATDGPYSQTLLRELVVEHYADGGTRHEKLDRDRRLLERDLERDPANARALFYLARTLQDAGDHARAAELYRRRAGLGGWDEEVYYSLYQAGALTGERDPDAALGLLLDAWQRRPTRAEALHELARQCNDRSRPHAAYHFAEAGLRIAYPAGDLLFIHRWIYDWGLRIEQAVAAHNAGRPEEALALNEELLADTSLPRRAAEAARANRWLALHALGRGDEAVDDVAGLGELAPSAKFAEVRLDVIPAWPQFNPSIAADGDGFRMIVRTANYCLVDGEYHFFEPGSVFRSINYVVALDASLRVTEVGVLEDVSEGPPIQPARVLGYEDCRLLRVGDRWVATATVYDRNAEGRCEVALLELDGPRVSAVHIAGRTPGRHEKNWMPFVDGGALHFVYGLDPPAVLRWDAGAASTTVVSGDPGRERGRYRGGSQGVEVDGGWLFVVHEVTGSGALRRYVHRFVLLDAEHRLAGLSPPFTFAHEPVEFCAGIALRGGDLVLSFGIEDQEAHLVVVSRDEVMELLEPVADITDEDAVAKTVADG